MKKELNIEELVLCAIFSTGLNSKEFRTLKEKSQIIKMYNQEPTKTFKMFLNFDKLVERINAIKQGEYVVRIPKELKDKENIKKLLDQGTAKVVEEIDLEDMFCALLTDKVDVEAAKDLLEYFLNKEYFNKKNVVTNRLMHSLQVMLGTGLACKSLNATFDETFTCMIISAFHDIGHVPFAHVMEEIIKNFSSDFSHEKNGKRVHEKIVKNNEERMVEEIKKYLQDDSQDIKENIDKKVQIIGSGIVEHSRKGSKQRGKGIYRQLTRALDKIFYFASDTHDLTAVPHDLTKKQEQQIGKPNEQLFIYSLVNKDSDDEQDNVKYMEFIQALKDKNFGQIATIAISSISITPGKDMVYYDVDESIWKAIMEQTKAVYRDYDFEAVRNKMEKLSVIVLAKKTAGRYYGTKKSLKEAFYETIDEITCMGEKDLYDYCRKLTINTNTISQDGKQGNDELTKDIKEQLQVDNNDVLGLFRDILVLSENEWKLMEELRNNDQR